MKKRRGGRSKGEGLTGGGGGAGPPTFEEIVKAEWSFVVDTAQSCGVPEAQCEDVAVEVFLRLERHFESMSSSEPPVIRAWLRTTTVHIAQEQSNLRAMSSISVLAAKPGTPADPDLMDPTAIIPTPEDQLMAAQTQGSLRSLVETLEPNRRDVFVLHVIEEEPMHEVARRLGIPEPTAYNRLRLAREDLQEILLRAWRADERKPGGRSFAVVPSLLEMPPETLKQLPREMWQALPRDVRQSLPRDVRQSLPRDVRQSLPRDMLQSLPREVHRSIALAAQSAVEMLSHCVSAAALAGGAALVAGAAFAPGKPAVKLAELAEPAKVNLIVATEAPPPAAASPETAGTDHAQGASADATGRDVAARPGIAPAPQPGRVPVTRQGRPSVPRDVRPSLPRDVRPSLPRDVRPSLPRDVRPSLPRDVRPSLPRDVRQSLPRWRPRLLLQLAASALHRGDLGEAASLLRMYRAEYPEDPLADVHHEVRSQLLLRSR